MYVKIGQTLINDKILWSSSGTRKKLFPIKGQIANILDFVGHTVSAATTQLCHYNPKAAIDSTKMNRCICVPIKLYSQK